ncbi:NIPSNAP family protein [Candidatus Latescibacterota bacterium]
MERRTFLSNSTVAGLAAAGSLTGAETSEAADSRDYYELQRYTFDSEDKRKIFDKFMAEAAIPAMNRIDVNPVGVFYSEDAISPVYVLRRFRTLESFAESKQKLLADSEYLRKGAEFLNIVTDSMVYSRVESSLMLAFEGVPHLETPVVSDDRVFQLRIYESPSIKTGLKKIEMFNTGELAVFRETGLNPVFFGETLIGEKMQNLTYMVGFNNKQEQSESWDRFRSHPEWLRLKAIPEFDDNKNLCGITNIVLLPAPYSQI